MNRWDSELSNDMHDVKIWCRKCCCQIWNMTNKPPPSGRSLKWALMQCLISKLSKKFTGWIWSVLQLQIMPNSWWLFKSVIGKRGRVQTGRIYRLTESSSYSRLSGQEVLFFFFNRWLQSWHNRLWKKTMLMLSLSFLEFVFCQWRYVGHPIWSYYAVIVMAPFRKEEENSDPVMSQDGSPWWRQCTGWIWSMACVTQSSQNWQGQFFSIKNGFPPWNSLDSHSCSIQMFS